jgi:hypothetical protein
MDWTYCSMTSTGEEQTIITRVQGVWSWHVVELLAELAVQIFVYRLVLAIEEVFRQTEGVRCVLASLGGKIHLKSSLSEDQEGMEPLSDKEAGRITIVKRLCGSCDCYEGLAWERHRCGVSSRSCGDLVCAMRVSYRVEGLLDCMHLEVSLVGKCMATAMFCSDRSDRRCSENLSEVV